MFQTKHLHIKTGRLEQNHITTKQNPTMIFDMNCWPPLAAGENFGFVALPANPSSLSSLSQNKDHFRELLTFAKLASLSQDKAQIGSTFANFPPELFSSK